MSALWVNLAWYKVWSSTNKKKQTVEGKRAWKNTHFLKVHIELGWSDSAEFEMNDTSQNPPPSDETEAESINFFNLRLCKKWMYLYSFFWWSKTKCLCQGFCDWLSPRLGFSRYLYTCPTWPHSCEIEDVILFGFRFFERSPTMRHQHEAWCEDPKKHLLIMWRFNPAAVHKWYMPKYSIFYILLPLFGTS